jgi:hypothetical protein
MDEASTPSKNLRGEYKSSVNSEGLKNGNMVE